VIEETAIVEACKGDLAVVDVQRAGGCSTCTTSAGCGHSAVAAYFARRTARVVVQNPLGARPGERVVVGIEEGAFVAASLALYIVPLGALILGAALGGDLAARTALGDLGAVAGGGAGLAAGLALARWIGNRRRFAGARATILRRLPAIAIDTNRVRCAAGPLTGRN
jgi:sigma-E factor negative regulatory protein RseC